MSPASALAAVALAAAVPVAGGGVAGVVTDAATGRPLPGAVVALDDLGRATVSDEDGWYWLTDVPPGPQHLSVGLLGYRSRSIHVLVPAGSTLRVDLALDTEPIEVEAVVVRGRIPVPGVDRNGPDLRPLRRVSAAAIANDPFAAEPDPIEALTGGPVARRPESAGGLHVRGGSADQVGYLLDGFPVFSPYHAGSRSSAWSPAVVSSVELRESPTLPTDALSGTVVASTVEPGDRLRVTGGAATSHVRLGLDGPAGERGGFLLGARYGFPGIAFHSGEASYLRGDDRDVVAVARVAAGGGRIRVLAFDNGNALRFSPVSTDGSAGPPGEAGENALAWSSATLGVGWDSAEDGPRRWSARAWRSTLAATARWLGSDPALRDLESERRQVGAAATVAWGGPARSVELGVEARRDDLGYAVGDGDDAEAAFRARDAATEIAAHASLRRRVAERLELGAALEASADGSGIHPLPYLEARWVVGDRLAVHGRYARTRQIAQSFRNGESIVGGFFPPELPVSAAGARAARASTGVAGIVAIPWSGARVVAEAYARAVDGWALVAPGEGRPFATAEPAYGSGTIRGAAVEWATAAARYGALASWGIERVELRTADLAYEPAYATRQRLRLGAVVFPTATLSVRVGWIAELGRRGTDTIGVVEWEACNLIDGGCEFAGTPETLGELGAARLPAYRRLDVSVRKHWHVPLGGREARVEAFASGSNLLGRANVLTWAVDPATGERSPIAMRPAAPLAAGVAWTF